MALKIQSTVGANKPSGNASSLEELSPVFFFFTSAFWYNSVCTGINSNLSMATAVLFYLHCNHFLSL